MLRDVFRSTGQTVHKARRHGRNQAHFLRGKADPAIENMLRWKGEYRTWQRKEGDWVSLARENMMSRESMMRGAEWKKGLADGASIALGYAPAALAFGLLAKSAGLSFAEAAAMSALVYAGASQYMALNLIAAGTGAIEIVVTTLIVNLRHMLMSATVSGKADEAPTWVKAAYAFGITDEVFAVAATRDGRIPTAYLFGVGVMAYGSWVAFTAVGFAAGSALPGVLQESMGIALYALFIALLMPELKKSRKVLALAATAGVLNSALGLWLPAGWAIVCATLASSVLIERRSKRREPA